MPIWRVIPLPDSSIYHQDVAMATLSDPIKFITAIKFITSVLKTWFAESAVGKEDAVLQTNQAILSLTSPFLNPEDDHSKTPPVRAILHSASPGLQMLSSPVPSPRNSAQSSPVINSVSSSSTFPSRPIQGCIFFLNGELFSTRTFFP